MLFVWFIAVAALLAAAAPEAPPPFVPAPATAPRPASFDPAAESDPESNVQVGARILQEYVHRMGTLEAGLQYCNGALGDSSARYARKVMAERERLASIGDHRDL